jgi:signal transduction histidine kinase
MRLRHPASARAGDSAGLHAPGAPTLPLTWRWRVVFAGAVGVSVTATVLVAGLAVHDPYRTPALNVALETWAALTGLLVCLLAYGLFRLRHTLSALVLGERQRLANSLHDGPVQELALIARTVRRLDSSDPLVRRVASATDRALYESREAIRTLNGDREETLAAQLHRVAVETGEREEALVEARLDSDVQASPMQRDALGRATHEGIVNAVRHGRATHVVVELTQRPGAGKRMQLALRVKDDGDGFDSALVPSGPGLTVISERAQRVGGELKIESVPGEGSVLEVVL